VGVESRNSHRDYELLSRDADAVANAINTWLGNPITRTTLKFVCSSNDHESRLDTALRKYAGLKAKTDFRDKIAYSIVKFAIDKGATTFGVHTGIMKKSLKDPIFRRTLSNVLEGIAEFGVRRPQVSISPFLVVWNFTHACNLRCKHCYENAGEFLEDELTTEEAKKTIDDFKDAGVVAIAFSGGEPLMRKDFFEIAEYAVKNNFYCSVASNGTIITPAIAKKMKNKGIEYVEISLDGFEKEHDAFRGINGAWKRACKGIKNCVAAGLDTCVATTITQYNVKSIPKFIKFIEEKLGVKRFLAFNYVPTRRGKEIIGKDLSPQQRQELLDFLYSKLTDKGCRLSALTTAPQFARVAVDNSGPTISTHFVNKETMGMSGRTKVLSEFIGGCGAGRLYCGMEPNGDILPCVFMPIKLGNIKENNIKEIWKNSFILKQMRNRDKFKGHCGVCEYKYICGGCRARAYGYFNDVAASDPGCIKNQEAWDELKAS